MSLYKGEVEKAISSYEQRLIAEGNALKTKWRTETIGDETFGGNRVQTSTLRAREVINRFGGSEAQRAELYNLLRLTGAGNALPVVRILNNVWDATMREGAPVPSQVRTRAAEAPQTTAELGNVLFDK